MTILQEEVSIISITVSTQTESSAHAVNTRDARTQTINSSTNAGTQTQHTDGISIRLYVLCPPKSAILNVPIPNLPDDDARNNYTTLLLSPMSTPLLAPQHKTPGLFNLYDYKTDFIYSKFPDVYDDDGSSNRTTPHSGAEESDSSCENSWEYMVDENYTSPPYPLLPFFFKNGVSYTSWVEEELL